MQFKNSVKRGEFKLNSKWKARLAEENERYFNDAATFLFCSSNLTTGTNIYLFLREC